jgi:hypothetical protein
MMPQSSQYIQKGRQRLSCACCIRGTGFRCFSLFSSSFFHRHKLNFAIDTVWHKGDCFSGIISRKRLLVQSVERHCRHVFIRIWYLLKYQNRYERYASTHPCSLYSSYHHGTIEMRHQALAASAAKMIIVAGLIMLFSCFNLCKYKVPNTALLLTITSGIHTNQNEQLHAHR